MLRLLTPLVSTIHALAITLIFMSVAEPAAADRIEVSPAQLTFSALGESQTVSVRVYDENDLEIEDEPFSYAYVFIGEISGDNDFREVSGGLEITAGVTGTGNISISIGNGESVDVPISVRQVPTTLTVTPDVLTLDAGQTATLQAALSDANGYEIQVDDGVRGGAVVFWESSYSAIATVEGVGRDYYNGKESGATADVTAVGEGTVTITANWLSVTTSVTSTSMPPGSRRSTARSLRSTAKSATLSEQVHVTVGAASANTAPTGLPTISGTARVGETLTASASGIADTDGLLNATFSWQWVANDGTADADIAGATAATYTLTPAETGKTVKVRATFTDDGGTAETLLSEATAVVEGVNFDPMGLPMISGTARAGETLTASASGIADADGLANATYAWQWTANDGTGDADIAGATEATHTLTSAEVGKTVKVRVTFTDDRDTEETVLSDAMAAVEAAVPPAIVAGGVQVTSTPQATSDTYGPGETITLTVTFDKAVTVDTTGGMPRIQFRLGPPRTDRWAEYSGGSGNTALTFTYEVQSGDMDSNGIWLPKNELHLRSGTIRDAVTDTADAALSYARAGLQSGHKVDGSLIDTPAIVAGGVQVTSTPQAASDTYGPGETIELAVTFDRAVTVDTTGGKPRIQFRLGPPRTDRWAEYSGGSGNTALTFTYEVQSGDMDSNGIWLPKNELHLRSGTIRDAATNTAAALSYARAGLQSGHKVDSSLIYTSAVSISAANDTTNTLTRSVTAQSNSVTEGTAAVFTLTRTGSLADALTVNVGVTETGAMLKGTPPATAIFNANSATAELRVETDDDEVAESASVITAELAAGSGYSMDAGASSATVTVDDDDAAPVVTTTSPVEAAENGTAIATLAATDDDTPAADLAWSIVGGSDSAKFTLSAGGDLAFAAAKDFEAPDDADSNGAYEITVRVTDGANPVDATLTVRLTDVDEIAPVLSSAGVDGDALTLTFDEALDGNSVPDASAFSVAVDGTARGVSGVSTSGSSVTLTLASAVVSGEGVTVGYTAPTGANASPLRGAIGNPVAGFSDEAVTNDTPASNAAPTGLPTVSGTPQVGEPLTASIANIADVDGLTNAIYVWQWIANDGTSDSVITAATAETYTLTSAEAGKKIKVRVTFTDDGGTEETLVSDPTAAVNSVPTGLPMISGTAQVGEALAASTLGIADTDGLINAAFAWQWIANDGTSDADIAGATGAEYTLTSAEDAKTIKVRVTFTDDGGTEETLFSEATAAVTVALPSVSIAAVSSPVTEGTAASFTLRRTGDTAAAMTVAVTVEGALVSPTPASSVTFAAGSAEATLSVATEDDSVAKADARVTVTVTTGSGYRVGSGSGSAGVDVYDNDEVASAPVKTLWTSTLEWQGDYGAGWVNANEEEFSSPGWSEDGHDYRIWYIAYGSSSDELWVRVDPNMRAGGIPVSGELTLQVGHVTVGSAGAMAKFARGDIAIVRGIEQSWAVGEQVQVRLMRTTAGETTVTGPGVSVADAQVQEAEGAVLAFRVTLAEAQTSAVSVRYLTSDGTATAGTDYEAVSGALRFAPGETAKTVSVPVLNDDHDEGRETLTLTLSSPFGAQIADGTATGTIVNTDPIPKAWIARFGRTVAEQVIDVVEARMRAPRSPGVELSLAGQRVGGSVAPDGAVPTDDVAPAGAERNLAEWFGNGNDPERRHGMGSQTMTQRDLLVGSFFSFTGGTPRTGTYTGNYALWGRGAVTRFDGREGGLSLDGEVTSGMLGADWFRDALMAGLVVSHSLGEGSYRGESGNGGITSSLTGLYPWGRYALSERVSVWGLAGYGEGTLTLTPEAEAPIRTDLDLVMAAAGLRGVLVQAPETGGFELAAKTDAMGVRTSTAKAQGLEAEQAEVTRLRLGLEGSRPFLFEGGASLTPSVEIGARHDGGDAETGFGVDIGGGLAWSDPERGLSAEVRGRGLLSHAADGFRERGFSGSLSWDPTPDTARGLSVSMSQTLGAQAPGGVDDLLERGTLAGLAANDDSDELQHRRLEVNLGYGFGAFGDRFTLTPQIGFGMSQGHREQSLGWRLRREMRGNTGALEFALEARRRESANDNAEPEHGVGLRVTARW